MSAEQIETVFELSANQVPDDYEWWCGGGPNGHWELRSETDPLQVYPSDDGPFEPRDWTVLARKYVAPPTIESRLRDWHKQSVGMMPGTLTEGAFVSEILALIDGQNNE